MQTSRNLVRASGSTAKTAAGWRYASNLPRWKEDMEVVTAEATPDYRQVHKQAAARQVVITYAKPRSMQIDWDAQHRHVEALHAAEAAGEWNELVNGLRHRMSERRVLVMSYIAALAVQ